MKVVAIGDLCLPVKSWNPAASDEEDTFTYIDIGSVSQERKAVEVGPPIPVAEAPSRARQLVDANDILVSTVRPNLNAVARVQSELAGATASTGFCVLRAEQSLLEPSYLFHWVRSPEFVSEMVKLATGQSYPAVSDKIIKSSKIPLPPLEEQRRIAAVLDQADALRRLRTQALTRLNALGQAIFHEMFGEGEALMADRLGDAVEEFRYGTSNKSGEAGLPTLRIPNVIGNAIDTSEIKTVEVTSAEEERLRLLDGDLLFVRTNGNPDYVGRCAVFSQAAVGNTAGAASWIFASYLIRARLRDGWNPYFLQAFLSSSAGRKAVRDNSKTSAGQYNINTEGLASLPIPKASKMAQDRFAQRLTAIDEARVDQARALAASETLFASLQHRAFRGEL